ncbi:MULTISPECIES: hypothetical protein [Bradyrhizobium]|uniref:Uncharacterized protein n=2 Tax=Bradyrhizobium TaxID=374 RepID=A0A9X1RAR1_9BRAD|nr:MULTISPECIES: hypothetical protein [Bradyrhizobium]MCG2628145.1 hypothetical protein [Bradyrhizobium zhengyangense]MCG2643264.1 hypothetical protein [Bradyrhizobium zhengyangense]MCG2670422.1 hypothetical protein [Bradyrhizobium zhengyangense]MDN4985843.1 hypothetical protein [Bradyrhizobium sp. WYCCWR 13022]MDN5002778.1 hypothetical protein [Bradyrhizobium sp. WYCCWR 12677]
MAVFGALRDASSDYWGRRVIEKHAGVPQLGELDYLLNSADDGVGALGLDLVNNLRHHVANSTRRSNLQSFRKSPKP